MNKEKIQFCFCTLAYGSVYRDLALLLAQDLDKYAPGIPFLVFTEKPDDFTRQPNVLAFKHQRKFFYMDNEKVFLYKKALSMFDVFIHIDADVRIIEPIPQDLKWLPGITARSCSSIIKHKQKGFEVVQKLAQKLELDIKDENIQWIYEFLFVVRKDSGKEIEFLKQFEMNARYLELNGVYRGCGTAMGLAAAKVGLPVRHDIMEGIEFFDDRVELTRIKNGQADPQDKLMYFEKQKSIQSQDRSLFEKVANKTIKPLTKKMRYFYHLGRTKIITLNDKDFYYR